MTNYPPGVTGNEYEIAGPDWVGLADRFCGAEYITTVPLHAVEQFLDGAMDGEEFRELLYDTIYEGGECWWGGDVEVEQFKDREFWTCPACGTEHERDVE